MSRCSEKGRTSAADNNARPTKKLHALAIIGVRAASAEASRSDGAISVFLARVLGAGTQGLRWYVHGQDSSNRGAHVSMFNSPTGHTH